MKRLIIFLILAASLLGNVVLLKNALSARGAATEGDSRAEMAKQPPKDPAPEKSAWARLDDKDLQVFADKLSAAGIPPKLRRYLIEARLQEFFEQEEAAINGPKKQKRYWERNYDDGSPKSYERQLAEAKLWAKKELLSAKLLGFDEQENPVLRNRLGFAPTEKWGALLEVMAGKVIEANTYESFVSNMTTEAERNHVRRLNDETDRALKEILTPTEIAEYKLRNSREVSSLRYELRTMDATESEFRAIAEIKQRSNVTDPSRFNGILSGDEYRRQQEERARQSEQIKTVLGAERYAAYQRSLDYEYNSVRDMCSRLELPADAPVKAYAFKTQIATESNRIFDDKTMSYDEKSAALKQLAENTRAGIIAALGEEAGKTYIDQRANNWIKRVETGTAIRFTENGGSSSRRLSAPKPQAATPKG